MEKQTYTYRQNPLYARSFLIMKADSPIGDYTILDEEEEKSLAEKKVMNIVSQLNGSDRLIPLGDLTRSRMLFHKKPKTEQDSPTEIVFYKYSGKGVSKENAILTIEGEV